MLQPRYLLTSLASNDLAIGLLVTPFGFLPAVYGCWPYGEVACQIQVSVSIYLQVAWEGMKRICQPGFCSLEVWDDMENKFLITYSVLLSRFERGHQKLEIRSSVFDFASGKSLSRNAKRKKRRSSYYLISWITAPRLKTPRSGWLGAVLTVSAMMHQEGRKTPQRAESAAAVPPYLFSFTGFEKRENNQSKELEAFLTRRVEVHWQK